MTEKCEHCEPEKRFNLQLKSLREYIDLKIQTLQAEYSKSELNYPTRQQLNNDMGNLLTKDEAALKFRDLERQIKGVIGFLVGLFMLFVADYLRR